MEGTLWEGLDYTKRKGISTSDVKGTFYTSSILEKKLGEKEVMRNF